MLGAGDEILSGSIKLDALEKLLRKHLKEEFAKINKDLKLYNNNLYSQIESFFWLQKKLKIKKSLPPLRGWAASPDVLLLLHKHIILNKPEIVVELGSGVSTIVIADALRQNGFGKLFSIEHSDYYGAQTLANIKVESLESWVELRVEKLRPWEASHLNLSDVEKPSYWYSRSALNDIENINLLWVDGPPGGTCPFSRYPAVPALINNFSENIEIWIDDTLREEEKIICTSWAKEYNLELTLYPLEKGLGRLIRSKFHDSNSCEHIPDANLDLEFDFNFPHSHLKG